MFGFNYFQENLKAKPMDILSNNGTVIAYKWKEKKRKTNQENVVFFSSFLNSHLHSPPFTERKRTIKRRNFSNWFILFYGIERYEPLPVFVRKDVAKKKERN